MNNLSVLETCQLQLVNFIYIILMIYINKLVQNVRLGKTYHLIEKKIIAGHIKVVEKKNYIDRIKMRRGVKILGLCTCFSSLVSVFPLLHRILETTTEGSSRIDNLILVEP